MGRLLLVRHGESVWNERAIVQGQAGPGLSAVGHTQAQHLGCFLELEAPDAAFVSSDLDRCRETGAPYEVAVGRAPTLDPRLRERHFGSWQGVSRGDLEAQDPALWRRFRAREDVVAEAGGESTPMLLDRVLPALHDAAAVAPLTVVMTHGGPIWHGVHALLGLEEGVLGPVTNAGVTVVDLDPDGGARLLAWNQVAHLPPDVRTTWPVPVAADVTSDGIT